MISKYLQHDTSYVYARYKSGRDWFKWRLIDVRVLSKQMVIYECCMQGVTEHRKSFKIRIFSF